jgi:hypothetical protein
VEAEIDRWAWWAGETRLPPLARYLLHASKLRYEYEVYEAQIADFHRANRDLDADVERLTGVLAGDRRKPLTTEQLLDASEELAGVEAKMAGATGSSTALGDLRRTVAIASSNLTKVVPPPAEGEQEMSSPFAADLDLAEWLEGQVEHDIGYADSVRDRADGVRSLLQVRFDHARERRMQEQNYLLLLQTALFSALIAGVTAYGIIKDEGKPLTQGDFALIAVAMSLSFALPLLAVHWYARYRWFDRVAAALLGASLGWLIAAHSWKGAAWAVTSAVIVGAIAYALTRLKDRWFDRRR